MRDPSLLVFRNAEINTNSTANNANIFTAYTGSKSLQDYLDAKQNTTGINRNLVVASSDNIVFRNSNVTNTTAANVSSITTAYSGAQTLTSYINTNVSNGVSTAENYTTTQLASYAKWKRTTVDDTVARSFAIMEIYILLLV
jgi:hypothetical protein